MGGVEGAIAAHADDVFAQLSSSARVEFKSLIDVLTRDVSRHQDDSITFTARVTDGKAFTNTPARQELVDAFVDAHLIIRDKEKSLWIAHEALLRHWRKGLGALESIADEELRKARRRQLMLTAAAGVFLLVAVLAVWFGYRANLAEYEAQKERDRAEAQLLATNFNLAKAHEEKAIGILNKPDASTHDYQRALLQVLQAQPQQIGGKPALRLAALNRFGQDALGQAFAERWASPSLSAGSLVNSLAYSPDGRLLASASFDKTVRLWDLRIGYLLRNGPAPSARAALISETLQRLWGLRVDGLNFVPESWDWLLPRNGYYVDQEISIVVGSSARTADGLAEPEVRTFNIRPLLDPPKPGKDKLDQLLRWLKEQGM